MTWRDVLRTLACCVSLLALVFAVLWAYETSVEISSLQGDIARLKAAQRPLVQIQGGKYLTLFTQEKEVVIEKRQ